MRRVGVVVLAGAAAAVLSLTGCSGSGDGSGPAPSIPPPTATPAAAVTSTTAAAAPITQATGPQAGVVKRGSVNARPGNAGQDGVVASVSAKEICSALKGIRSRVQDAGTNREARAEISIRLTQVYSAKHLAGQMQPAAVDSATKQTCPRIRTQLLRSAGLKTLADI